jgi:hypothetical protein
MYKYALLTGLGIGVGIGMIMVIGVWVKVCINYNQIDIEENIDETNGNESDSSDSTDSSNDNNRGYIRYLENILDNSTEVTTNSFTLHHVDVDVDVSYNIINPEFVIVPPNPANPPNSPNSQSNPTPSAPLEPSSNVITIENEDILGNIEYTYVEY